MKYILEIDFETERHCLLCPVRDDDTDNCKMQYCGSEGFDSWEEQMENCPLKLVDVDALERKKPKKVVSMETTNKFKNPYGYHPAYGHCPVCGRIYWDKCHVGNYCDVCGQKIDWRVEE